MGENKKGLRKQISSLMLNWWTNTVDINSIKFLIDRI